MTDLSLGFKSIFAGNNLIVLKRREREREIVSIERLLSIRVKVKNHFFLFLLRKGKITLPCCFLLTSILKNEFKLLKALRAAKFGVVIEKFRCYLNIFESFKSKTFYELMRINGL